MDVSRHQNILIASDDAAQCDDWHALLMRQPSFQPHIGTSLAEVLRILTAGPVSCVIQGPTLDGFSGFEFRKILREILPGTPVILYIRKRTLRSVWENRRLRRRDYFQVLSGPHGLKNAGETVRRAIAHAENRRAREPLRNRLIYSPSYNEERQLVLQTSLDILNNDAKDLFIRIFSVLGDLPDNDYTSILNDHVNELYDCTSEALGFMRSEKRIEPLIDIVNSIKLGKDKIPLPSESRLELSYGPRRLLFIEVSRLVKYALGNVVENALKFSPPLSPVRIRIDRDSDSVSFTVADQGPGIPPAMRRRLFTKEFHTTTSERFRDAGKGLWIASTIVREERGDITLADNTGGGCVVTVRFPCFSLACARHELAELGSWFKLPLEVVEKKARIMKTILQLEFPETAADLDSLAFANLLDHFRDERRKKERQKYFFKLREFTRFNPSGIPVLLVDDSLFVHYHIAPLLVDRGFHIVDFAFNGVEAYNLYRIFNPAVVIMDITMPVKSGIETAEDIFRKNPRAKILFVTALGDYQPLLENLERRFHGLCYYAICKPIRPVKLLEALTALINARS